MGTHLRVLIEGYLMNTNMTGFRGFQKPLHQCPLDKTSFSIGRVISCTVWFKKSIIQYPEMISKVITAIMNNHTQGISFIIPAIIVTITFITDITHTQLNNLCLIFQDFCVAWPCE